MCQRLEGDTTSVMRVDPRNMALKEDRDRRWQRGKAARCGAPGALGERPRACAVPPDPAARSNGASSPESVQLPFVQAPATTPLGWSCWPCLESGESPRATMCSGFSMNTLKVTQLLTRLLSRLTVFHRGQFPPADT